MFIDKLAKKEKIGLSLALIIVFAAVFDRLVIAPINARIKQMNQEAKTSEKQLAMGLRNLSQKEAVSSEFKKYANYVRKAGADEEEAAAMLSEIESLARKSGIGLADVKPQQPRNVDFYKEYSIEIEVEGAMDALTGFLYLLNNSTQLLRIEKLRMAPKDKDSAVIKSSFLITKVVVP